jgi:hypothetical protein
VTWLKVRARHIGKKVEEDMNYMEREGVGGGGVINLFFFLVFILVGSI